MNEHGYIRSIHRHIPSTTYKWKINDNYAGGVPDVFYCDLGGILFGEYKYLPKPPKRPTTVIKPKLSGNQLVWLEERYMQNVPVVVALGTPIGSIVFTDMTWNEGITREQLEKYALPTTEVARIIHDHCIGNTHVDTNEQTYPNCRGSGESLKAENTVEAA